MGDPTIAKMEGRESRQLTFDPPAGIDRAGCVVRWFWSGRIGSSVQLSILGSCRLRECEFEDWRRIRSWMFCVLRWPDGDLAEPVIRAEWVSPPVAVVTGDCPSG